MFMDLEVKRKIFHMYALIFPLFYLCIPKIWMVFFLFLVLCATMYLDITRNYNEKIKQYVDKIFSSFIRLEETSGSFKLSGASFMAWGLFLSSLLFPKGLAITAFFILIISDCFAALVGMKIGHIIINGKTLEGSIAFFVTSILISMLCYFYIGYSTSFIIIIASCLVSTLAESYAKNIKVNDNLLIPLSYGLTTSLLNFIFGL